jgi:ketosteroid isomerase-like protein
MKSQIAQFGYRSIFFAVLLSGTQVRPLAAQASGSVEDSVRALESRRAQALLKADTVALSQLVADDFVEISRLGMLRTKADNLREIASGALKLNAVRYDSLVVRIYGDVAVLQGIADNSGTFRGFPFTGKIRYTRVFVRRAGRWQAVAMQQTSMQ